MDENPRAGMYFSPEAALERALRLVEEGADILDLGAESTRPGAKAVSPEEELGRLLPALKKQSVCRAMNIVKPAMAAVPNPAVMPKLVPHAAARGRWSCRADFSAWHKRVRIAAAREKLLPNHARSVMVKVSSV